MQLLIYDDFIIFPTIIYLNYYFITSDSQDYLLPMFLAFSICRGSFYNGNPTNTQYLKFLSDPASFSHNKKISLTSLHLLVAKNMNQCHGTLYFITCQHNSINLEHVNLMSINLEIRIIFQKYQQDLFFSEYSIIEFRKGSHFFTTFHEPTLISFQNQYL